MTELDRLMLAVERDDVEAMRLVAEIVRAKYGFRVEERTVMPFGVAAFFDSRTRTAVVRPITNEETFASRLHEFGHGIVGPCPQREPHRIDPTVRDWWNCIACETAAWRAALDLVPFTLPMFQRLQASLGTYRRTTPAGPAALRELDTLVSFRQTYAEPTQRKVETAVRREWLAQVQAELLAEPNSIRACRAKLAAALR